MIPALTIILFLATACSTPPAGNPKEGLRWFGLHHCNGCHGEYGSGGRGPRISKTSLSYRKVIAKVRNSNSAIMPSFPRSNLSDDDVADIYAFLQADDKKNL